MHREILNLSEGVLCDHIDHNGLNNQKNNLRPCTHSENTRNRTASKSAVSKYLGVFPSERKRNPWRAMISVNGEKFSLGNHRTKEGAAHAYNTAALINFKEFSNLNIIGSSI